MSYQDVLVSFALYQDSIRSYFTHLCFKNQFRRLSLWLCVVARLVVNIQHSIGSLVVCLVWCHYLQKLNKSPCTLSDTFSTIILFLMFLNIQIDFIILKTYDQKFTLTTKKSLHIIFNAQWLTVIHCVWKDGPNRIQYSLRIWQNT